MKKSKLILQIALPFISIAVLLLIWSVASIIINSEMVLPSVLQTISALVTLLGKGEFYLAFFATLLRSLIAFFTSFIVAVILAIFSKRFNGFKRFISPIISIIRSLPTIAVIVLILIWTNRFIAPIIVTSLVVFPTVYTNVYTATNEISSEEIEMCRLYGVSEKQILFRVVIPQITPALLTIIASGIALNLKLMVAGEVIVATANSLGNMLNLFNVNIEIANMFAVVLITVITGLIIELSADLINKRLVKWK